MRDAGRIATERPPPAWPRAQRWLVRAVNALVAVGVALVCVLSYPLAASYLGRATPALAVARVAGGWLGRPLPGLAIVRRATARFAWLPVLRAPGAELLWVSLASLYAVFLATAVPAALRGSVAAGELRVEDLVHGWKTMALGWCPDRQRLVALHGSGAEQPGFSVIDLSDEPPVARFRPFPWREDESPLVVLSARGLALAHGARSRRRLTVDVDRIAAEATAEEGIVASAYDPEAERLYLVSDRSAGAAGAARGEVLSISIDAYLRGEVASARRYPIPERSGAIALAVDRTTHRRLLVSGGRGTDDVLELDLSTGALRSVRVPPVHAGLAIDGARGRAYVTNSTRSSLFAIDLERMEVEREIWIGGVAGPVAVLAGVGALAVGTQLTGELVLLDAETLETRARLVTCRRGDPFTGFAESLILGESRDLAWDERGRALYLADGCGVRRVRLPAGWCGGAGCAAPRAAAAVGELG
ncbi:MAG: hypothetical protein U0610_07035 [bacterium]